MPSNETFDDRLLTRYLLGALSAEEAERLDELSIVDDDFVARLNAVEDELVDAYVRNELTGPDLQRFTTFYLASAKRRQKVDFAEALQGFKQTAAQPVPLPQTQAAAALEPEPRPVRPPRHSFFPRLAFAGVALILVLAVAYLVRENLGLRSQIEDRQAGLQQHDQQLQKDIEQQRSENAETLKQLEQARASAPKLDQLKTVALLLTPPTRGAGRIPSLALDQGTDLAVLSLMLESADFPAYRAALKDPAAKRVLWQSGNLVSSLDGEKKAVSISFPANLLKQQTYLLELIGIPAKGRPESVASYPFRVVLK